MPSQITESWAIHQRIHLYLLGSLDDAALTLAASKGRNVGEQFAHIHNVRLMWLKSAGAPEFVHLVKLEKDGLTVEALHRSLTDSGASIEALLDRALGSDGKVKGFKPHATAFFAYLVSHESHHRGQIAQTLRLAGRPLDKKVAFGLWEWGVR